MELINRWKIERDQQRFNDKMNILFVVLGVLIIGSILIGTKWSFKQMKIQPMSTIKSTIKSITFTGYKNGEKTNLFCTIENNETECSSQEIVNLTKNDEFMILPSWPELHY